MTCRTYSVEERPGRSPVVAVSLEGRVLLRIAGPTTRRKAEAMAQRLRLRELVKAALEAA